MTWKIRLNKLKKKGAVGSGRKGANVGWDVGKVGWRRQTDGITSKLKLVGMLECSRSTRRSDGKILKRKNPAQGHSSDCVRNAITLQILLIELRKCGQRVGLSLRGERISEDGGCGGGTDRDEERAIKGNKW